MIYEYDLSDMNVSAGNLHCDLNNKADWAYNRKMLFKLDLSKQAPDVFLFRKLGKQIMLLSSWTTDQFNVIKVRPSQEYLGLTSEDKFTLNAHLKDN